MKALTTIFMMIVVLGAFGCAKKTGDENNDPDSVKNEFSTPGAAFEQARQNLHLLLSEGQRNAFGLGSADEVKALVKTTEIPITFIKLDQLKDSSALFQDGGFLYAMGKDSAAKICITVTKNEKGWIQNTIGMKNVSDALNEVPKASRLVEALGLEMSFLEEKTPNGIGYRAIRGYGEAGIEQKKAYSKAELMRLLENYRVTLERKFGKEFSSGNLDK